MRDRELERLSQVLTEKDIELAEMEDRIKTSAIAANRSLADKIYSAMKGDVVDEFLAKYVNLLQC